MGDGTHKSEASLFPGAVREACRPDDSANPDHSGTIHRVHPQISGLTGPSWNLLRSYSLHAGTAQDGSFEETRFLRGNGLRLYDVLFL